MTNIALFDMDNSLADYESGLIEKLNLIRSQGDPCVTRENIWKLNDPWIKERIRMIKSLPGWWMNLHPIKNGFKILNLARDLGFDIHVLTKGPKEFPRAWDEKVQWCQTHLGAKIDIHLTCNKSLVYGKILYDDYPEYLLKWLECRPRGLGIMPVNSYNVNFNHPNVIKWDGTNLEEITQAMKFCLNRKKYENLRL